MNKFLSRIAKGLLGLSLAAGVGVAVANHKAESVSAGTESVTFSEKGYTNGQEISTYSGANFTITFDKGTNKNAPKYYTSGTAIRVYGSNYFTVSSSKTITSITLTFGGSDSSNAITTDVGTFVSPTWSGSENSVKFTVGGTSGNRRLAGVSVEFEDGGTPVTSYNVIDNIQNGSLDKSSVDEGTTLSVIISPDSGYYVPESVSVLMGGSSVAFTYSNNNVVVQNVTGDITITGSCVAIPSPVHAGTQADPYTVEDAIHAIDLNSGLSNVYATGIVSKIVTAYSTQFYNITFDISKDGSTEGLQLRAFRCKGSSSYTIDDADDIKVGATVVVYGTLVDYNGTKEFSQDCTVVSYHLVTPLTSITLSGEYQKVFEVSDSFNHDGLVVTAHYQDESEKTVTNFTVSSPDMSTAGEKTITVSYTENDVKKETTYTISVLNQIVKWTVSFDPGLGSGEMDSVEVIDGESFDLPECSFTAPEGKAFDHWEVGGVEATSLESVTADVEVVATWKDKPAEISDVLNNENTIKGTDTTYKAWTATELPSGAEYSGQSAGDKTSIQIRSNNNNSGVVSTKSGGNVSSVEIKFNTETAATRTVNVYGKTSAYSAPTDLYNDSTAGTLIQSVNIDNGATQTVTFTGNYQYVGIRSKSGAIYLESITVVWTSSSTPEPIKTLTGIDVSGAKTDFTVGDEFVTTGLQVLAHYSDADDEVITSGYDVDSSNVNKDAAGTYNVVITYLTAQAGYDVTYSNPAPIAVGTYKKVESNLSDFTGDYLIVYEGGEDGNWAFDGSLPTLDASSNRVEVSISNDKIELSEAYEFHIAAKESGYSIKSKSGMYIGKTADSNGIDSKEADNYNNGIVFTLGETGDMTVTSEGGAVLRYNSSSGQDRFRFFKSSTYTGQKAISLYVQVNNAAEELALDILNLTSPICSAEEKDFTSAWSTLSGKWDSLSPEEKAYLVGLDADADGTFVAEALARYEIICSAHKLTPFMEGRVISGTREYSAQLANNSSTIIIVVVAITSITSIGVLLVIKRHRIHQ